MELDNSYLKGRPTMATIAAMAEFQNNYHAYHYNHSWDDKFTKEVMFVMCDPQCHPPKTGEQLAEWFKLTSWKY